MNAQHPHETCDYCKDGTEARYEAKTKQGPGWAYMCERHFHEKAYGRGMYRRLFTSAVK